MDSSASSASTLTMMAPSSSLPDVALNVAIIVAYDVATRGIGINGHLPWRLAKDIQRFREITTTTEDQEGTTMNAVIMGRRTWESIAPQHRPLRNRINVVITSNVVKFCADAPIDAMQSKTLFACTSLKSALNTLNTEYRGILGTVFVIGGQGVYKDALEDDVQCATIFATEVQPYASNAMHHHTLPDYDRFFPALPPNVFVRTHRSAREYADAEKCWRYRFVTYTRRARVDALEHGTKVEEVNASATTTAASPSSAFIDPKATLGSAPVRPLQHPPLVHEETQYLNMIADILHKGNVRGDRTGVGTRSLFGRTMRFSLRDGTLPLFTTKRVYWTGVKKELLWFLAGSTDARILQRQHVHIWDGNSSRAFLDSRGLHDNAVGDLGPVYGFQWRHFGAEYMDCTTDYKGRGVDQLKTVIQQIKTKPNSRSIVMSAWNPVDIPKMALPPCHVLCQFYVHDGKLSCQMYQRSADMGLGVPFNVASYALLTHMIAHVCGLEAHEFIHVIGDAHVYLNHVEALKTQLERTPRPFPRLRFSSDVKNMDAFRDEHFVLEGYRPHKPITMAMAV